MVCLIHGVACGIKIRPPCMIDIELLNTVTCTVLVSLLHSVSQCAVQTDMFLCVCISYTCVEACM